MPDINSIEDCIKYCYELGVITYGQYVDYKNELDDLYESQYYYDEEED